MAITFPSLRRQCLVAFSVSSFGYACTSSAVRLDIHPASSEVPLGSVFNLDVVVSDLNAGGQIVSSFDLDITFDPAILAALGVAYGAGLGGGGASSLQFAPSIGPGLIDFAEASLLADADLDLLQGDSVVLATLQFRATGLGISSVAFASPDPFFFLTGILDGQGIPTDLNPSIGGARVRVLDAQVPLPGVGWLMLAGLLGCWGARKLRPAPMIA